MGNEVGLHLFRQEQFANTESPFDRAMLEKARQLYPDPRLATIQESLNLPELADAATRLREVLQHSTVDDTQHVLGFRSEDVITFLVHYLANRMRVSADIDVSDSTDVIRAKEAGLYLTGNFTSEYWSREENDGKIPPEISTPYDALELNRFYGAEGASHTAVMQIVVPRLTANWHDAMKTLLLPYSKIEMDDDYEETNDSQMNITERILSKIQDQVKKLIKGVQKREMVPPFSLFETELETGKYEFLTEIKNQLKDNNDWKGVLTILIDCSLNRKGIQLGVSESILEQTTEMTSGINMYGPAGGDELVLLPKGSEQDITDLRSHINWVRVVQGGEYEQSILKQLGILQSSQN